MSTSLLDPLEEKMATAHDQNAPQPEKLHAAPPRERRVKPPTPAHALRHRDLREDEFWRHIPAFAEVDREQFLDHRWQMKHSVYGEDKLIETVRDVAPDDFLADAIDGFHRAPMAVRVTPYLLSLIDWSNPYTDPIRTQFIPVGSRLMADHPMLTLDSLHEQADVLATGLVVALVTLRRGAAEAAPRPQDQDGSGHDGLLWNGCGRRQIYPFGSGWKLPKSGDMTFIHE